MESILTGFPEEASNPEKAINEGAALETVLNMFNQLIEQTDFIVAHNISFDEKILGAELLRKRIKSDADRFSTLSGQI